MFTRWMKYIQKGVKHRNGGTASSKRWTMIFCFLHLLNRPRRFNGCSYKMVSASALQSSSKSHRSSTQSISPKMALLPHWTWSLTNVVSQDAVRIYLELYVAAPSWAVDDLKCHGALQRQPVTRRKSNLGSPIEDA